jgi:hypothetical protein
VRQLRAALTSKARGWAATRRGNHGSEGLAHGCDGGRGGMCQEGNDRLIVAVGSVMG